MARRPTPRQQLDTLLKLMSDDIRTAFLGAVQDVVDNALIVEIVRAIEAGDLVGAFQALGFTPAAMRPLVTAIERAFETGGVFTGEGFPKYLNTTNGKAIFRFDTRNSRAEAFLRDKSSQLVTRLTEETRINIQTTLQDGLKRGLNPRNVALDIVGRVGGDGKRMGGIVGLTSQQEEWVRSTRNRLQTLDAGYFNLKLRDQRFDRTVQRAIDSGKPLPSDVVEKLVARYKDKALKYRGDTIARTEALQALNASEYEAIKQAVDLGATKNSAVQREWDSAGDSRVRWSHKRMNGQRVGLDDPFVSPSGARMLHPGDTSLGAPGDEVIMCRCRAKTIIDWLADID